MEYYCFECNKSFRIDSIHLPENCAHCGGTNVSWVCEWTSTGIYEDDPWELEVNYVMGVEEI